MASWANLKAPKTHRSRPFFTIGRAVNDERDVAAIEDPVGLAAGSIPT